MKQLLFIACLFIFTAAKSQNVGIGTTTPQHLLHVQGTLFVNSQMGSIKLGYPGASANFWEFVTINGGSNIRLRSTSSSGTERYPFWFGQSGMLGINLDTTANIEPQYALHVAARNKYAIYGVTKKFGIDTVAGVYGFANSTTPTPYSAGVRGESNSINENGIGVLGTQTGSGWGVAGFAKENSLNDYAAGVFGAIGMSITGSGTGGYGILGHNYNTNGVAGAFKNYGTGGKALVTEGNISLKNLGEAAGKVLTSDAAGNATWQAQPLFFVHKAIAANTTGHITILNYPNQLQTDILLVTPNYNPPGGPNAYNNHAIGVFWNGTAWTIFNQDIGNIVNTSYNVMVKK